MTILRFDIGEEMHYVRVKPENREAVEDEFERLTEDVDECFITEIVSDEARRRGRC